MSRPSPTLGTLSTLSIGLGGMVGGGIFATTGLAVELTKGAVPIAFIVSGIVALLTSYSYLKMTLRYPSEGGTVEFLNRGFGTGIVPGAANILLCFSYVVLVAIYAHALGSYASSFFPAAEREFWKHVFLSSALVSLTLLNAIATMGSAGFLFIFMAVNAANFRLAVKTNSRRWISALGTLSCGAALIMLCVQVDENPSTRNQFWILIGMAGLSLAIEVIYRRITGRTIRLGGSKMLAPNS